MFSQSAVEAAARCEAELGRVRLLAQLREETFGLLAERDQARAWAKAWKESARANHDSYHDAYFSYNEAMRQYDIQQKRACDAEAAARRLREALEAVDDWFDWWNDERPAPAPKGIPQLVKRALKGADDELST